jgi:serine/threonine protein kinase
MKNRIRNFDIQTKLGSGSYGVIYKALNKTTREICVLKQISLSRLTDKARKNVYAVKHRQSMRQQLWENSFIPL